MSRNNRWGVVIAVAGAIAVAVFIRSGDEPPERSTADHPKLDIGSERSETEDKQPTDFLGLRSESIKLKNPGHQRRKNAARMEADYVKERELRERLTTKFVAAIAPRVGLNPAQQSALHDVVMDRGDVIRTAQFRKQGKAIKRPEFLKIRDAAIVVFEAGLKRLLDPEQLKIYRQVEEAAETAEGEDLSLGLIYGMGGGKDRAYEKARQG